MIKHVILYSMTSHNNQVSGSSRTVRRKGRARRGGVSEAVRAIRRAFPQARAARVEILDGHGSRTIFTAELLPEVELG
jgi:hypothetical protein